MSETLDIINTTKGRPPRLPFLHIKDAILGKKYELSLVFIGDLRSRRLNQKHRGKDKKANVLSFPLEKDSGEIFINLKEARREAPSFGQSERRHVAFLFIHGLLHLKGLGHGEGMEKLEEKYLKQFGL